MDSAFSFTTLLGAFLAGIGTSFTPCVYPLIPVTLALFGAGSECPSKARALGLGICYVLGISLTFTLLGVLTAQSGAVFGAFLGHPVVIITVVMLLMVMALFTLEIIELPWLSRVQQSASTVGGRGFFGAFLMGTASGPVAAPCVGPVLVSYLTIAADSKSAAWGALLLFVYSLGFGLLFLLLALFPALLRRLPRPGAWMNYLKFIMAGALIAVAIYMAGPYLHGPLAAIFSGPQQIFVLVGLLIATLLCARLGYSHERKALRLAGALCLALAVSAASLPQHALGPPSTAVQWHSTLESALASAKVDDRIVLVDLFAEWCAACKELDAHTFPDPLVVAELRRVIAARLDFTLMEDQHQEISDRYKVLGLPTILFLRGDGTEIDNSRITGFLEPEDFARHMRAVLDRSVK